MLVIFIEFERYSDFRFGSALRGIFQPRLAGTRRKIAKTVMYPRPTVFRKVPKRVSCELRRFARRSPTRGRRFFRRSRRSLGSSSSARNFGPVARPRRLRHQYARKVFPRCGPLGLFHTIRFFPKQTVRYCETQRMISIFVRRTVRKTDSVKAA